MTREEVIRLIDKERQRQEVLHGTNTLANPGLSSFKAITIIAEEFGEMAKALLEEGPSSQEFQDEVVQVAACCVALLESLDA